MGFKRIRVDSEVWAYLEAHARPFVDKEPNDVLRRELRLEEGKPSPSVADANAMFNPPAHDYPSLSEVDAMFRLPPSFPAGLRQPLEIAWLVRREGLERTEATHNLAKRLDIAYQSVLDKYCRELGLRAGDFDRLLEEPDLTRFEELLLTKFPEWGNDVRRAASFIKGKESGD